MAGSHAIIFVLRNMICFLPFKNLSFSLIMFSGWREKEGEGDGEGEGGRERERERERERKEMALFRLFRVPSIVWGTQ